MTANELSSQELERQPTAAVVDIRNRDERLEEIGFIPGSRNIPEQQLHEKLTALEADLSADQPIIFVCLSGRRSLKIAEDFNQTRAGNRRYLSLSGGILDWKAQEFPTCRGVESLNELRAESPEVKSLDEFARVLVSCFVAESIEAQLSQTPDDFTDPTEIVGKLLGDDPPDALALEDWLDRVDSLAVTARVMGHPLERIAVNVDRMRVALHSMLENQAQAQAEAEG